MTAPCGHCSPAATSRSPAPAGRPQHDFRFFPTMRWSAPRPARAPGRRCGPNHLAVQCRRRGGVLCRPCRGRRATLATVGPRSRDRILVDGATNSILDHLAAVLGGPVTASIGIGTARANRKPVLEVFDVRGRTLGFAKVGIDATSRKHVRGEADKGWPGSRDTSRPGMALPEVLRRVDVAGQRGARDVGVRHTPAAPRHPVPCSHGPRVCLLPRVRFQDSGTRRRMPFWRRQLEILGSLAAGQPRDRLERVATRLGETRGEVLVEAGAWHGDWTPWNMAWRGGELQVWDLEQFAPDGLVGLDVAHYVVNERMQQHGVSMGPCSRRALSRPARSPRPSSVARWSPRATSSRWPCATWRPSLTTTAPSRTSGPS